jgi:hypothetical protein
MDVKIFETTPILAKLHQTSERTKVNLNYSLLRSKLKIC